MKLSELNLSEVKPVSLKLSDLNMSDVKPAQEIQEPKAPGYFSRVGSAFKEAGSDIISEAKRGADVLDESLQGKKNPLQVAGSQLRVGLRTAGAVTSAAFAPIVEAPIIKPLLEKAVGQVMKVPGVDDIVRGATEIAEKYPDAAKDADAIINIATLGVGKAAYAPLKGEVKAIGQDAVRAARLALTPSEEAIQSKVTSLFQKSIKPTAKKTLAQGEKYQNDTLNALKTIKSNADSLEIQDISGELVTGRTPQTINELSQALDQTKKLVFKQYDDLAKQAGQGGAFVDAKPIAGEILKVAQNNALKLTNPEVVKYAESWADRLKTLDRIDTETTQAVIQNLNQNLQAFYRNPTYDAASKVAVDAAIANNFRKALDTAIETATGKEYQALKNQYSALKAIENDVTRAAMRDARKNTKGLLDYTDMFTSGQMVTGIISLNPAMFTKGAIERGFKEYIKFLNDPNRAIANIFEKLDVDTSAKFVPQSATGKYLQNPSLGLSVQDVSKNIHPEDAGYMKKYIDAVRLKGKPDAPTMSEADWLNAERLLPKFGISPDKSQGTIASAFEQILTGQKKVVGTAVPGSVKSVSPLTTSISKAKASGQSFDEWVKEMKGSATQYGKYSPQTRAEIPAGYKNITELGIDPEEIVTVYRGIDDIKGNLPRKINDGDFVTTDFDSALSYAGKPEDVVEMQVKAKTLYNSEPRDFRDEPFYTGAEYIYTSKTTKRLPTDAQLKAEWDKVK